MSDEKTIEPTKSDEKTIEPTKSDEKTIELSDAEMESILSVDSFNKTYRKVLVELDALYKGVFDQAEAERIAALCLLSQASLAAQLSAAEHRAKTFKREIEFKRALVYLEFRNNPPDGKKVTETSLENLVVCNAEVQELYSNQNIAEKEAKEYASVMAILKDAHITFRTLIKRGV